MRLGEHVTSSTWPGATPGGARRIMARAPLAEGEVLDGKYRVERVLGAGGMGVVVAATHVRLAQRVAIKFLLPHAADDDHTVARFAREARALARLDSEHVARVIDVGALETGVPYMVLEHLVGHTLADLINARGPLPIDQAVTYALEACEAMAEAHAAGIVHRDLKPENLFLANRPDGSQVIKVIDFGISKMTDPMELGPRSSTLTGAASIVGSPLYMSPEQLCAARDADARSDIWSLGVTLFELLTGEGPFVWRSVPELCAAVLKEPARPLRVLLPDAPEGLEAVLMRCLDKDPSKRPADMAELGSALRSFGPPEGARYSVRALRVLHGAPTPREIDDTPLHASQPEWPARPSETLQLSGMTTGTRPDSPSFWSLRRMAAMIFLAAMLVSLATVRGLRGRLRVQATPSPPSAAAPFAPAPVTLEPEPPAPSLPLPPSALPRPISAAAPPKKAAPHPLSMRGPRAPPRSSKVESAFDHRK
jgi:eukaryotic-like serine/threonine-protein kinase